MKEIVFDAEFDGLSPTKIHCLSANLSKDKVETTYDYSRMRKFFTNPKRILVGHNITRFDIPVVERLLGIKVKAKLVDTLIISWYLEPKRVRHGLAEWGEEFGVPKPKIDDWDNLTPKEYAHRCEQDVLINMKLWRRQWKRLVKLYGSPEEAWRLIDYLQGKMDVAALQEACKWRLDIDRCKKGLEDLTAEKDYKVKALAKAMPKVAVYKTKNYPAKPYKQDGSLSESGKSWFELLKQEGLPEDHILPVKYVSGYKEPNPGSVPQVKDWLYSLGWKPTTFKHVRNKETNEIRKIEQINDKEEEGVCRSIKELYHKEPSLELLDGLSILTHRISILQGFLDNVDEQGYVQAQIQGITNTLRFKHKVCVNLPGVRKPYGELIRGCLIADEGYELCGSDMSSLEDRTKMHWMHEHDPEYVKEMQKPGWDPHLELCVLAGLMTQEQADWYKTKDPEAEKQLGGIRHDGKQINYSCAYGVTPQGIVRNAGMSLSRATKLHATYWKRNWSLQAIADNCVVKTCDGMKWLFNPVSKLWYALRHDKDRFSTLNQGTGTYCFDVWINNILKKRRQINGQFHDEGIFMIKKGFRKQCEKLLRDAIKETNEQLKLNRELDIDVKFGDTYAEIH